MLVDDTSSQLNDLLGLCVFFSAASVPRAVRLRLCSQEATSYLIQPTPPRKDGGRREPAGPEPLLHRQLPDVRQRVPLEPARAHGQGQDRAAGLPAPRAARPGPHQAGRVRGRVERAAGAAGRLCVRTVPGGQDRRGPGGGDGAGEAHGAGERGERDRGGTRGNRALPRGADRRGAQGAVAAPEEHGMRVLHDPDTAQDGPARPRAAAARAAQVLGRGRDDRAAGGGVGEPLHGRGPKVPGGLLHLRGARPRLLGQGSDGPGRVPAAPGQAGRGRAAPPRVLQQGPQRPRDPGQPDRRFAPGGQAGGRGGAVHQLAPRGRTTTRFTNRDSSPGERLRQGGLPLHVGDVILCHDRDERRISIAASTLPFVIVWRARVRIYPLIAATPCPPVPGGIFAGP